MPLYTVYILSQKTWPFGEILCDLWLSLDYTACLCSICTLPLTRLLPAFGSYLCSIYTVFCITVDRFCSIRMPARYRVWRTKTKIRIPIERLYAVLGRIACYIKLYRPGAGTHYLR